MSVRRQLLNFGGRHTDFRVGEGAFGDLTRMLKSTVNTPRRAVLAAQPAALALAGGPVRRSLADAGFLVDDFEVPDGRAAATFEGAARLYEALDGFGTTTEDLVVAFGDADCCALAGLCASSWLGGCTYALLPTTLDAMVGAPTVMNGLGTSASAGVISVQPSAALVVCDLDLVAGRPIEERGLGLVQIVSAYLMESKRYWERVEDVVAGLAAAGPVELTAAICEAQTARVNALKATSPSARNALQFGCTTAQALRACLGPDVPEYLLFSEGMRFEARLAVDAAGFSVDDVFKLDDCLEDLGVDELGFELEPERFIAALKAARFKRANRFMLPLPKRPGFIRLATVDDDVLAAHAEAYLASRAELLEEA